MYSHALQRTPLAAAIFAAAFSMSPLCANAQDSKAGEDDEPTTLSAITVTAQKREELLQDVPISLTALPEQLLQDTGVRDVKDLQVLVPGLTVISTQNESLTTARIRGIGTVGDNAGLESSVGVVIDGVYRPRNGVGFGDLGEIERIEVLKGPQGTLFGKNTSAGVINVITRRPSYTQSAEGEVTVGNYGAIGVSGAYNDALSDNAAFRIYAAKRQRDGFLDVERGRGPRAETEDNDQNFHSLRAQLLFELSEALDINVIGDFTSREENCCGGVTLVRGATAAIIDAIGGGVSIAPVADPFDRVSYANRSTEQDTKDKGVSVEINYDTPWFGGSTLTGVLASRDWQSINGLDFDYTAADLLYRNADKNESFTGFKTDSAEFRLAGATDKLDWLFGVFYVDEDLKRNDSYRIGAGYEPYLSIAALSSINPALAASPTATQFYSQATGLPFGTSFSGLGALDRYQQNSKSLAFFTNDTWHATEALDLTLGLRYTREKKQLDSVYSNPNGSRGCSAVLTPAGQERVAAALLARGVSAAALASAVPAVIGRACLPWSNALHNGRVTDQEREEKEWSGTLKAAYRFNEHWMSYLSAARGYKAGGFNLDRVQTSNGLSSGGAGIVPVDDTSFPGEFVDSYELGTKTTWADGNLLLNATLFYQTYDNFQLNSFLGTSYVVRSIPEVVSKGVDTEILWQPATVKGLLLQGGITYADTRYGDTIPGADFSPLPAANPGQLYKLPGSRLSFAPEFSGSASATYEWAFGNSLLARFNIGTKYMSKFSTGSDLDPEKEQDAYTVVNARVGIGSRDKRWTVELWGQNIFDEEYAQVGFDAPLQTSNAIPNDPRNTYGAFLGAPATYGVTLRVAY
ncbi:MAG: TonB-dependent receptor [Luteimonas sp.]